MLVGAAVIIVGLVIIMRQRQMASKPKRTAKKAIKVTPAPSPTSLKSVATGTGSVKTPGGRRSARIARKSLGHDD